MMEQFIPQPDLVASNRTWTITLNPNCIYSLTTTTGQRKGIASSPPPSPFPLPYREGFEGYRLNATPRYLSDMGGAFEVVARDRRRPMLCASRCIVRASTGRRLPMPIQSSATTAGATSKSAPKPVSSLLPEDGKARSERLWALVARWFPGATWIHFATPQPAGYCFRLFGDGRWELTTARKVLAQGTTSAPGTGWHKLSLRCAGDRIVASLDGKPIADVRDSTYPRGLVGFVSRFHPARFDNLQIASPSITP